MGRCKMVSNTGTAATLALPGTTGPGQARSDAGGICTPPALLGAASLGVSHWLHTPLPWGSAAPSTLARICCGSSPPRSTSYAVLLAF